jgi:hypothetical protein
VISSGLSSVRYHRLRFPFRDESAPCIEAPGLIIHPVNSARKEKVKPVWALLLNLCYDLHRVVDVVVGGVEALLGQLWVSFFQNLPNALTAPNPFQLLEHDDSL